MGIPKESNQTTFTMPSQQCLYRLKLSLPRPAATKSLILSVTIKTQIPLSRIADGDGSAKPGFIAVLHSQQGGKMLYHKFLNHKFLYHPPTPRRENEPVGISAPHRVEWDQKQFFPPSLRGRIFMLLKLSRYNASCRLI